MTKKSRTHAVRFIISLTPSVEENVNLPGFK